jgi:chromosome segregation ATPase
MMDQMFGQVIRSGLEAEVAELRPRVQALLHCEQEHGEVVVELQQTRLELEQSGEQAVADEEHLAELQSKLSRCQAELTTHTVIKDQLETTIQASRTEHEHTSAELTRHQSLLHEERRKYQSLSAELDAVHSRELDVQEELNEWENKFELQVRLLHETTQRKEDLVRMLDERTLELRARNASQNEMEQELQDQQTICSRLQKQLDEGVCVCGCVCLSVCLYVCLCVSIYLPVYLYVSVRLCVCVCDSRVCVCVSVCMCVCMLR